MPQISVIVPVYKVEPYLRRCVDSILAQTFTDFELILVDDGSPDNCGAICDAYAKQDKRVHENPNGHSYFEKNLWIYESAYPKAIQLFWYMIVLKNKILKK